MFWLQVNNHPYTGTYIAQGTIFQCIRNIGIFEEENMNNGYSSYFNIVKDDMFGRDILYETGNLKNTKIFFCFNNTVMEFDRAYKAMRYYNRYMYNIYIVHSPLILSDSERRWRIIINFNLHQDDEWRNDRIKEEAIVDWVKEGF